MGLEEHLPHLLISMAVPMALMVILYPFARLLGKHWISVLILSVLLSAIVVILKEFWDSQVSVNDIIADVLAQLPQ